MPSRLTFEAGNHTYKLAPPGGGKPEQVPSVTGLLDLLAKPALTRWAANTAADYATDHWLDLVPLSPSERRRLIAASPWQARDRAAAKGTAIHRLAEALIRGIKVEVPEELHGKVNALARWLDHTGILVEATEQRVYSDHDDDLGLTAYAGTFDAVVKHPQLGLGLIDWKTGSGIYPDYAVQLAAYATAQWLAGDEDRPMPRMQWLGAVHIQPDTVDLHILPADQLHAATARVELLRMLYGIAQPAFALQVGA